MSERKVGGNAGKGRKKGVPNKATASVKAALAEAFERVTVNGEPGGVDSLVAWGNDKPEEFYKLWAKMLPTDVKVDGEMRLGVVILPPVAK